MNGNLMLENSVYLGLGTNLGEKLENLKKAIDVLSKECGEVEKISSIYESEPWGFESSDVFYNMVILLKTKLDPESLLTNIKGIELKMGRKPKIKEEYESRIIDLDILYFNEQKFEAKNLTIPHPHITKRPFVYLPLLELLNKNSKYSAELNEIPKRENLKKLNKSELFKT